MRHRYRSAGFWSAEPVDVVRSAAARHPDRVALLDRRGEITYVVLDESVDAACRAMIAAGVTVSTPVVVVVGNDVDSVVAVHAALRVGAVVLLVPRSAGATQVGDILSRTAAAHGMAPNWPAVSGPGLSSRCIWINPRHSGDGGAVEGSQRPADEPCLVLYTSGTTSKPKGVVHSQSTLIKSSSNYIAAAGLSERDRIFLISPLASVTGVLQAVFIAPMLSAPVVLEDRWDPAATCDLLVSSRATWYGGPDRLLDRILDEAVARRMQIPLHAVYLGGTMLDRHILRRIENEFGVIVMRAYGSSEVPVSTSALRHEAADVRHADDGVPLDDVEVRVGSAGEPTECCIRGPHAFLGYSDQSDDIAAFDGDWIRTGDMADLTGGRVRIIGRIKEIVIRNGMKIAVAEVEEAIARIDGVRECAAYPAADATTGERLAIAVVLEKGVEMSLSDVADALVLSGLPKYKLPEELVIWKEPLPVNANGKVERNKLDARSVGKPRVLADRLVAASLDRQAERPAQ
ncbi:class I adenylate-forming enzyme family protein [Mycobacterium vicinigordonae]|uniref:Long-chain fatty acid--CoA ligase n=1 Tax=Mycobacterium vicinigordonae TaxID=1719132 RepID=A0A7D6IWB1_9MYCO|nr:long-chain fatty acid--CoA ligase [Mycobacterium vicinigordonae]